MLYYFYRIGSSLALRAGLKTCYKAAVICADIYCFFAREDKKNLEYNLKIALGTNDRKIIKKHIKNVFRNFAKHLVDFLRLSRLTRDYILSHANIEGKENVDKALGAGKGVVMVTAHHGNWEMGAAMIASLGCPFYAIALDHKDKRINDFFLRQRAFGDVKIIPLGTQIKKCFKVLKKNNLLAIVGDRDFSDTGVKVNFFGHQTILPKGPAIFSLRTGAPIIPTFTIRTKDDNVKLIFEKPLESKNLTNSEADVKNLMREYLSVIERYIRDFPGQWYAFRKVWD